jgi:hypothetical protein
LLSTDHAPEPLSAPPAPLQPQHVLEQTLEDATNTIADQRAALMENFLSSLYENVKQTITKHIGTDLTSEEFGNKVANIRKRVPLKIVKLQKGAPALTEVFLARMNKLMEEAKQAHTASTLEKKRREDVLAYVSSAFIKLEARVFEGNVTISMLAKEFEEISKSTGALREGLHDEGGILQQEIDEYVSTSRHSIETYFWS